MDTSVLPISSINLRPSTLKATPQNGLLEYDGTNLCFTVGTTRYKISLTSL